MSGFNISSKIGDSAFGFFGNLNPLSNFHPSNFLHGGHAFHCSEQFIQYTKAMYFKEDDIANRILLAKTGLECKQLAREITSYSNKRWRSVAKELCAAGIDAKFRQNPTLQDLLLETRDLVIVECTYDTLWGTGIPLQDDKCLDHTLWHNQGILGEILEDIRSQLRNERDTTITPIASRPNKLPEINDNNTQMEM